MRITYESRQLTEYLPPCLPSLRDLRAVISHMAWSETTNLAKLNG